MATNLRTALALKRHDWQTKLDRLYHAAGIYCAARAVTENKTRVVRPTKGTSNLLTRGSNVAVEVDAEGWYPEVDHGRSLQPNQHLSTST